MPSLQLHPSIYDRDAVEQTAQAFKDYGTYEIHQSTESDHLQVNIEPTDPADTTGLYVVPDLERLREASDRIESRVLSIARRKDQ